MKKIIKLSLLAAAVTAAAGASHSPYLNDIDMERKRKVDYIKRNKSFKPWKSKNLK